MVLGELAILLLLIVPLVLIEFSKVAGIVVLIGMVVLMGFAIPSSLSVLTVFDVLLGILAYSPVLLTKSFVLRALFVSAGSTELVDQTRVD